jgi:hypothetical protein
MPDSPIKREVTIGGCRLILGDCMEVMPLLEPADMVLLDPPFEIWGAFEAPHGKTVIAFCSPQSRARVEQVLGKPRAEMVWHFEDGRWVSNNLPRITHDYIYIYGDTGGAAVGDRQDIAPSRKGKSSIGKDILGDRTYYPKERKHLNSVQIFPRNMSGPLGAWGKPIDLMCRLVEFADKETVLDPFMGSGTTLVACAKLGRKGIGIEIDPDYFEIACERVRKAYAQPDMFIERPEPPKQETMEL